MGASFALSVLLAVRMAFTSAAYAGLALVLVAAAALAFFAIARGRSGPALLLGACNALFVVPELGLRSAGFRHVSGIQFGYPSAEEFAEFELDPELFWKLPPDGELVNSWGLFGPEPRIPKPAGTSRIVYLGDSCSQQGYPEAWPEVATSLLASAKAGALDEVNLALSGYSSHQGRVLAERHLSELDPDLVVVFFGWNDHWLARGAIDADKHVDLRFEGLYRASRTLQLVRKLTARGAAPALERPRVPLELYRENLRRIVELATACGARTLLVTAPSTHDLAVPEYLVARGFVATKEQALRVHAEYNGVVRELASELDVALCDLELELRADPQRARYFLEDGIHFSVEGRRAVAARCVQRVRDEHLLP